MASWKHKKIKKLNDSDYSKAIGALNQIHYKGETSFYTESSTRPIEDYLIKSIPIGKKIIDVGCGPGRVSSAFLKAGHDIVGVDIVYDCIEAAKLKFKELKDNLYVCDMCNLLFEDNMFDEVISFRFSFNALPTLYERTEAIKEMLRVCKPGGRVLIESFNYMYPGRLGFMWLAHITDELSKIFRKIAGCNSPQIPCGDIIYLAAKDGSTAPGYAHLPTLSELRKLCQEHSNSSTYRLLSEKQLISNNWIYGLLKSFNYSIWIELKKKMN